MKAYKAHLRSDSPYSQSRHYVVDKLEKESCADYEQRTWRSRMHVDANGDVFIPPTAFKNCLSEAAKFLSMQVPGKGKSTYTKHVEAGIMVTEPTPLQVRAADVPGEELFVPASGRRGDGNRVSKVFPLIASWEGDVTFYVLDETVTRDVLAQHLSEAGKLIGIGRFRPRKNGYYGRFSVSSLEETDV